MSNATNKELSLQLLGEALDQVARTDEVAAAVRDKGEANFVKVMASGALEPQMIATLVKRLSSRITRQLYSRYNQLRTEIRRSRATDYDVTVRDLVDDPVAKDLHQMREAAEHLHLSWLAPVYQEAENAAFSWIDGFQSQGLPFYYSQRDDGTWAEFHSMDEAFDQMDVERDRFIEQQAQARRESLKKLKNLKL